MICTSSYKDWKLDRYRTYSISLDRGKDANYKGKCYPDLAPKLSFWKTWHSDIGKVPDEINNKYYVKEYWDKVLSKLDPEKVYDDLDYSILLCYEDNTVFCHRHIVAAWFELLLDLKVPEVKLNGYLTEEVSRPEYIKEYLEDVMKSSLNMKGFNSLRALYLFNKGELLEQKADELEKTTDKCHDNLRQAASYLRSEADMAEDEYNEIHIKKLLK